MKTLKSAVLSSLILAGCGGGGGVDEIVEVAEAVNSAPEISGRPGEIVRADETFSFTPEVFDADGDMLEFEVVNLPSWAYFDAGSGAITGYPQKSDYGSYENIEIKVSDGDKSTRMSFSLDVLPRLLGRDNFDPGQLVADGDGFRGAPAMVMEVDGEEREYKQSNLRLKFNDDGDLLEMAGDAIVPRQVSQHASLDFETRADVDYYSGKQLNTNPDIDILLHEHQNYYVYHFKTGLDMTLKGDPGTGQEKKLKIGTPIGAEVLLINDPSDSMYYVYGDIPLVGAGGFGVSENGLIPFEPSLDYEQLYGFNGHTIEKAGIGLGVKIFDLFSIDGIRVTRLENFNEILFDDGFFDDPFDSGVAYTSGINGTGSFAFGVVGFEIFSFDLTEVSALLDVGFERQHLAMRSRTAPDFSWLPESFVFVPETETIGDWYIDGDGNYEVVLSSTYRSGLPEAVVDGEMVLRDGEITMTGQVDDGERPLGIEAVFFPGGFNAEVDVLFDFDLGQRESVISAIDEQIDAVGRAAAELQSATEAYEWELSLGGLRQQVPTIVKTVNGKLDGIPGSVRSAVYSGVLKGIKEGGWNPVVNEVDIATKKADTARDQAQSTVDSMKKVMNRLKTVAAYGDDEDFKSAIKAALKGVLDNKKFSRTFTVKHKIAFKQRTLYTYTRNDNVLTGSNLTRVQEAYNNIDRINSTHSYKLQAQRVFDALPLEQALSKAKSDVEQGVPHIPRLEGVGFSVEGDVYSAYAVLDGEVYDVGFNVLNPAELVSGLAHLVADQLI